MYRLRQPVQEWQEGVKIYGELAVWRRKKKLPGNANRLPYKVALRFAITYVLKYGGAEENIELIVRKGKSPRLNSYELQAGI